MKGRNSSKVSIRLSDKSIALLKEIAAQSGLSMNGVVRMLLNKGYMAYRGKSVVSPTIPLYNSSIHRGGDKVLVRQGKKLIETIVPELDAGGYPIPEI